ncbi:MAG: polysaccharide deacetylase family protein [Pseudomonadota bacterium]
MRFRLVFALSAALAAAGLAGCASRVVTRTDEAVVVKASRGADAEKLAKRFLGDRREAWRIADFNGPIRPGDHVLIPLGDWRPTGVRTDAYQVVPVLAYHRFEMTGPCKGMVVCAGEFARQLDYLEREGYHVVPLSDLAAFLKGERQLPQKAVVLTIDDGWRSTAEIAEPILRERAYPATLFLYTDFVGASAAIDWATARNLDRGGIIDVQSHSKTHADLTQRRNGETSAAYAKRVEGEMKTPADALTKNLGAAPFAFSYPYGATDQAISEAAEAAGYDIALTVRRGPNPAFAHPFVLRRTMIYGEDDLPTFARRLTAAVKMEN